MQGSKRILEQQHPNLPPAGQHHLNRARGFHFTQALHPLPSLALSQFARLRELGSAAACTGEESAALSCIQEGIGIQGPAPAPELPDTAAKSHLQLPPQPTLEAANTVHDPGNILKVQPEFLLGEKTFMLVMVMH